MQNIDALGINCYRDLYGTKKLLQFGKMQIDMPIIFSEIGKPAVGSIQEEDQAKYIQEMLIDAVFENRDIAPLAFICEATDQEWKVTDEGCKEDAHLGIFGKKAEGAIKEAVLHIDKLKLFDYPALDEKKIKINSSNFFLIKEACEALEMRAYSRAIEYAKRYISLYEKIVDSQQSRCLEMKHLPSSVIVSFTAVDDEGKSFHGFTREVFEFSELNNIGFCHYIIGRAFYEQDRKREANEIFEILFNKYSYSQFAIQKDAINVVFSQTAKNGKRQKFYELIDLKEAKLNKYLKITDLVLKIRGDYVVLPSFSSQGLVSEAWRSLLSKDYECALAFSDNCLELHKEEALHQEYILRKTDRLLKADEMEKYGVLNDVGTCCFIKIRAHVEQGKIKEARKVFKYLEDNFPYSRMLELDGGKIAVVRAVNKVYPNLLDNIIPSGRIARGFYTVCILMTIIGREISKALKKDTRDSLVKVSKPFEVKQKSALSRTDRWVFLVLLLLELDSMVRFILFWAHPIHWSHHFVSWPLFCIVTFMGSFFVGFYLYVWHLLWSSKIPEHVPAREGLKVAMVTTYVQSEPLELVKETLVKMKKVRYIHDIFVLDESDNQQLKRFCNENGSCHFSRKDINKYNSTTPPFQAKTKAGNLNAWLDLYGDKYEFVTFLDPDHQPQINYLDRILGYFQDASVAFVQAPHVYHNTKDSWIARGGAEQNYYFVSPIQLGLYGNDSCLVNGSHSTFRVKALKDIGGYAVHNADDVLTSLRLHGKRWKGVYVPEILAYGLTPSNWGDYLSQQFRWAHSMFDLLFFYYPRILWKLKFPQLLGYLSIGTFYIFAINFLVLTMLPALSILTHLAVANTNLIIFLQNFLAFYFAKMAFLIFWSQRFLLRKEERGVWWRGGLLLLGSAPHVLLAFLRAVLRKGLIRAKFVTSKGPAAIDATYIKLFVFHLALIIFYSAVFIYSFFMGAASSAMAGTRIFLLMGIFVLAGITFTSTKLFYKVFHKK